MAEPPNVPIGLLPPSKPSCQVRPAKSLKRKRQSPSPSLLNLTPDQKDSQAQLLREELSPLILFYHEIVSNKVGFGFGLDLTTVECKTVNEMVALLIEESQLPLGKLIEELKIRLETKETTSTMAGVKSAVLLVGQRIMYGVPNLDADVLEDDTPSCLWCWETRDLKLMPKSLRSVLKVRRECRRRIHERLTAVSAMLVMLQKPETDENYRSDLMKATEKLGKALVESDIRSYMDGMLQKNGAEMAGKEVKREEKLLIRQLEKNKRASEKEKRRMDLEVQKEKLRLDKEQRKLQEETEKAEKRREKEESGTQKQSRKQQDETEKEKRRREKEEAQLKKQIAVQKQASIMEKFLKLKKTDSKSQNDQLLTGVSVCKLYAEDHDGMSMAVTQEMDSIFSSSDDIGIDDIRKTHISSWRHHDQSLHSSRKRHWSIRQKPKTNLVKELKLTANRELDNDDELCSEKLASTCGEHAYDDRSCVALFSESLSDIKKSHRRKQLLQFDKCHRPPFYGIWPRRSNVVRPRHPLKMDPELDYDVDSDEEWEEEDPGESLSDCDKDEEAECLEEGSPRAGDEEESEDGFFVPDGYFSENEGVEIDKMDIDFSAEEAKSSPSCTQDSENVEFYALIRQQKHLQNFTKTALKNNQPCFILNIVHEKDVSIGRDDLSGKSEFEKMWLQGLSMRAFPGGKPIEISIEKVEAEDEDDCVSNAKAMSKPISSSSSALQEMDMRDVISAVQSCSQSIGKVIETLQQKFPTVSKFHLRSKVREISDFVDNRWQVKKEVLEQAGVSNSPEVVHKRTPSISAYFSKRCMPPLSGKRSKIDNHTIDTLLQTPEKPDSGVNTLSVSGLADQ
ncbi:Chromatin assembly factor 1 subunit FAS1 [Linum perenne]